MTDGGKICSAAHVIPKAGQGVNSLAVSGAYTKEFCTQYIKQAEAYIDACTRYKWGDYFSGADVETREILRNVVSDLAAMYAIQYDMSGYTSRLEAQTMLDVLRDRVNQVIDLLKDKLHSNFLNGA